ncbi:MAG TPA: 5'-3' exonuclease H3TH domain-containing protein [Actinomycetes bacterium]|nr:5'-3' exonuclease H3TH domain-containing protein [Actinomycetes bacterium]
MSVPAVEDGARLDGARLFELPAPQPGDRATLWRPAPGRRAPARRRPRRPPPLLLAVDGNALAHRVFHAVGGDDADPGAAPERFLAVLARVAASTRATACVVGFDDPERSVRRDLHPAYKAQRPAKSGRLLGFLDQATGLVAALGLSTVVPDGLEADDVLGSAAHLARSRGFAATLVTGDRDAFSLVSPTVTVWLLANGGSTVRVSPSRVAASHGIPPAAYLEFAALRGDSSDNLPGVRGIGAMTAARLLRAYPTVTDALDDPEGLVRLLGPYLARTLVDQREVFEHNRELMRIRVDVPLDLDACNRPLPRAALAPVLAEHGLGDLTDRLARALALIGQSAWRCPPPP